MNPSTCPACGQPIDPEHINVAEGVALCQACGELSRLAEVVERARLVEEVLQRPPHGCSVTDWGDEIRIHATLRSTVGALGTLAIAVFCLGILSEFVLAALAALYMHLVGPLPAWLPAPAVEGFDTTSLGGALLFCLVLLPFILIGAVLIGGVLIYAAGSVEVRLRGREGVIRTGVGPLRWTRRFKPASVRRVLISQTGRDEDGHSTALIRIETGHDAVEFGSTLSDERRDWLRAVLHVLLLASTAEQRNLMLNATEAQPITAPDQRPPPW